MAISLRYLETVKYLLDLGADPSLHNKDGIAASLSIEIDWGKDIATDLLNNC